MLHRTMLAATCSRLPAQNNFSASVLWSVRVVEDKALLQSEVEQHWREEVHAALSHGSTNSLPVVIWGGGVKMVDSVT